MASYNNFEEESNSSETSNNIRNGKYYLELVENQKNKLLSLAEQAERDIESLSFNSNVSDDILGCLRSAAGKARLLMSQKIKQFEELCNNHMTQEPGDKFPTTLQDLEGYFDIVQLEVRNVIALFEEIDYIRANGWQKLVETHPVFSSKSLKKSKTETVPFSATPTNPRRHTSLINTSNNAGALPGTTLRRKSEHGLLAEKKREAQRKLLKEMKEQSRLQKRSNPNKDEDFIKIFVDKDRNSNNN